MCTNVTCKKSLSDTAGLSFQHREFLCLCVRVQTVPAHDGYNQYMSNTLTQMHTHTHTHTHTHRHPYTLIHTHTSIYSYTHTNTHTHTHTDIHIFLHTHTHIHTYTIIHILLLKTRSEERRVWKECRSL